MNRAASRWWDRVAWSSTRDTTTRLQIVKNARLPVDPAQGRVTCLAFVSKALNERTLNLGPGW